MSIHTQPIKPIPEETARVAHLAFPKGNRYLTLRDALGTVYKDQDFIDLFRQLRSVRRFSLATSTYLCDAVYGRPA
jgi:transposase